MREQVLHLIRQDAPPLQVNVLGIGWRERHRDEFHCRLLGRAATLVVIAAPARRRNVVPAIAAAVRYRSDVIARQITCRKSHRTIKTKIRVPLEQRAIVQRRNVFITITCKALARTVSGNYRIDIDLAALTVE